MVTLGGWEFAGTLVNNVLTTYWREHANRAILLDKYITKGYYAHGKRVPMYFQYVAGTDNDLILREIAAQVIFNPSPDKEEP